MVLVPLWTREQRNQLSYPEVAGGFFHKVDLAKKKKKIQGSGSCFNFILLAAEIRLQ